MNRQRSLTECTAQPLAVAPLCVASPAGAAQLDARVGTHASFLRALLRRLASREYPELERLHTRRLDDPSIALLDAWAVAADVLTFYNRRLVNESYLRTATECRSLVELANGIGYRPGPGVAASTFLAFELEKASQQSAAETLIPRGAAVKSIPGDGQLPQTFETSRDLIARPEWSAIRPRQVQPQDINPVSAFQVPQIVLRGTTTQLKPNDVILIVFPTGEQPVHREVERIEVDNDRQITVVQLQLRISSPLTLIEDVKKGVQGLASLLGGLTALPTTRDALDGDLQDLLRALRPEIGLVELDKVVEVWCETADTAVGQIGVTDLTEIKTVDGEWQTAIKTATDTLKNSLPTLVKDFLDSRGTVDKVVNRLDELYNGPGGISEDLTAQQITAKLKPELTSAAQGSPQTLKDSVEAIAAGPLKTAAEALVKELKVNSTSANTLRAKFRAAWARFAPADLEPKAVLEIERAQDAIAQPTFLGLGSCVDDALNDQTTNAWLIKQAERAAESETDTFDYTGPKSNRIKTTKQFSVKATGWQTRLGYVKDSNPVGLLKAYQAARDAIADAYKSAAGSTLSGFTSTFDSLKTDIRAIDTQFESSAVDNLATDLAAVVTGLSNALAGIQALAFEPTATAPNHPGKLGQALDSAKTAQQSRRKDFVKSVQGIVERFGEPAKWTPSGPQKAKDAYKLMTDYRGEIATPDGEGFLKSLTTMIGVDDQTVNTLKKVISDLETVDNLQPYPGDAVHQAKHAALLQDLRGLLAEFSGSTTTTAETPPPPPDETALAGLIAVLRRVAREQNQAADPGEPADLDQILAGFLEPPPSQTGASAAAGDSQAATAPDLLRQIVQAVRPDLSDVYDQVWLNLRPAALPPRILGMRTSLPLFGYNAPEQQITVDENGKPKAEAWKWNGDEKDEKNSLFLSQVAEGVVPGDLLLLRKRNDQFQWNFDPDDALTIETVSSPIARNAYGISAKCTRLALPQNGSWDKKSDNDISSLRTTVVLLKSDEYELAEEPLSAPIGTDPAEEPPAGGEGSFPNPAAENPMPAPSGAQIELDGWYPGLEAGRWVAIAGDRQQVPGARHVHLAQIRQVRHRLANVPGAKVHTTIAVDPPLRVELQRDSAVIHANVVHATHGETVRQLLGSGDARRPFQRFALARGPLTYLPAPNAAGAASTLSVRVNDLAWRELPSLAGALADQRAFVVRHEERPDAPARVVFGDGQTGARLPTGQSNVQVEYRVGLGAAGNVPAGSLSQLGDRPMGVKGVFNPLPATGGADSETVEQIRDNAPLAVMALDRLVSVRDFADFARNYAAIDKAVACRLWLAGRSTVHVTLGGAGNIPIAPHGDLLQALLQAYRELGDPELNLDVQTYEPLLVFLQANIKPHRDYLWRNVERDIRAALGREFGYERRRLAENLHRSQVQSAIQRVPGVEYVDIDYFAALPTFALRDAIMTAKPPEQVSSSAPVTPAPPPAVAVSAGDKTAKRLGELAKLLTELPQPTLVAAGPRLGQNAAGEKAILPAQLVYLDPLVADSLYLREIAS